MTLLQFHLKPKKNPTLKGEVFTSTMPAHLLLQLNVVSINCFVTKKFVFDISYQQLSFNYSTIIQCIITGPDTIQILFAVFGIHDWQKMNIVKCACVSQS